MSLGTSNRDGGKTSESGHLRALGKLVDGDIITGLGVSQRASGANMSIDIAAGDAFVRRSDGSYSHPVFNDAVYNLPIPTADGANPRRDIIVLYVDYNAAPSTAVSNNTNGVVKIKVVNGTPAGSPVDPTNAAIQSSVGSGNPYTKLARVRVPAGQTSISNSLIDDLRSLISAKLTNGVVTAANTAFGGNYSTSEVNTGFTWIDGKTIYKKTVSFSATGANQAISHGVSGMSTPLNIEVVKNDQAIGNGFMYNDTSWTFFYLTTTDIIVRASSGSSSGPSHATIYYTK